MTTSLRNTVPNGKWLPLNGNKEKVDLGLDKLVTAESTENVRVKLLLTKDSREEHAKDRSSRGWVQLKGANKYLIIRRTNKRKDEVLDIIDDTEIVVHVSEKESGRWYINDQKFFNERGIKIGKKKGRKKIKEKVGPSKLNDAIYGLSENWGFSVSSPSSVADGSMLRARSRSREGTRKRRQLSPERPRMRKDSRDWDRYCSRRQRR